MKFNVTLILRGAGGTVEAPAMSNPVEASNLRSLMYVLVDSLIDNDLVQTVGLKIEPVDEEKK